MSNFQNIVDSISKLLVPVVIATKKVSCSITFKTKIMK